MSLVFRTPASAYHYEPGLLNRLQEITTVLEGLKEFADAPFGWDIGALEFVQYEGGAVIVAPLNNKDGHSADIPLIMLPDDWAETCCFPLIIAREAGIC